MPKMRACVYCGRPIRSGKACQAHRDLLANDPAGAPARRPLTEAELEKAWSNPQHDRVRLRRGP